MRDPEKVRCFCVYASKVVVWVSSCSLVPVFLDLGEVVFFWVDVAPVLKIDRTGRSPHLFE